MLIIIIVLLLAVFYPNIIQLVHTLGAMLPKLGSGFNFNFSNVTTIQQGQNTGSGPLINYTLGLINKDRQSNGLGNVTLSNITSAQQHADSMLDNNYFSHWDIYGMKPYMRYTLLGGLGAVQENIAYTESQDKACIGSLCTDVGGGINLTGSLSQMEYNMMYNDSGCCNNGHRDNILSPSHNQVSIGVAYNGTSVYLVEDFINNYITWLNNTPRINRSYQTVLEGHISPGYNLSSIEISYDPPVVSMSLSQLDQTSEYGYGTAIAGVVSSPLQYYKSIGTIVADSYYVKGSNFFVSFDMNKLIVGNGPGEYTVMVWLNGTTQNNSTLGSTYTIFVNSNDTAYVPSGV